MNALRPVCLLLALLTPAARASQLIARDASNVQLKVNAKGEAPTSLTFKFNWASAAGTLGLRRATGAGAPSTSARCPDDTAR